ncbi:TPA: thioesterase family protein [Pseudomonas aeruginosa]
MRPSTTSSWSCCRAWTSTSLVSTWMLIDYLAQAKLGDPLEVRTQFIDRDLKRLHIVHNLHLEGHGEPLAVSEQMLMNIDFNAGKSCAFAGVVDSHISELFRQHQGASHPGYCGRTIAIRR